MMDVHYEDEDLELAELDPYYRGKLDSQLVKALRRRMTVVRGLNNEVKLRQYPSLHFEKLKGKRAHQYSIRLTIHWRLILEIEERPGENNNLLIVKGIENHYED